MKRFFPAGWAVLLILILILPVTADTYYKVYPTTAVASGTIITTNSGSLEVAVGSLDGVFAYFQPTNEEPHQIETSGYASGYSEFTHGYISNVQIGMKYHIYNSTFNGDQIDNRVSVNNGTSWPAGAWPLGYSFPAGDYPVLDATVCVPTYTDTSADVTYERNYSDISNMNRWGEISGDISGYGVRNRLEWVKLPNRNSNDGESFCVDSIYLNVLTKLTVTGEDLASGSRTQGSSDIPLLSIRLKTFANSTFDINSIQVDLTGTCQASDIDTLKLYQDTNKNNVIDSGEPLLGSVAVSALTNQVLTAAPLINDPAHNSRYIFAVDFNNDATVGVTVGMTLSSEADFTPAAAVDSVASQVDRDAAGVAGDPDPATLWPIYTTGTVTVSKKATLSASFSAVSTPVTKGDNFDVTLQITNEAGAGTAINVLPNLLTISGTGNAVTSQPNQIPITLAGGESGNFTWEYTAISPGDIQFTGSGYATDEDSNKTVTSSSDTSNTVTINDATVAILQVTDFTISPTTVSDDSQVVTVQMIVKNVGDLTANNVLIEHFTTLNNWELENIGTGSATDVSAGQTPVNITAGASDVFDFSYQATGTGTLQFKAKASADNCNTVSTFSQIVTIVDQAALTNVSILTSPSGDIGKGATFTLVYTVRNDGTATATNVTPAGFTINVLTPGTPDPSIKTGPSPISVASLAAGESTSFTWVIYSNNTTPPYGTYTISAHANYNDGNSGFSRSSSTATTSTLTITNSVTPLAIKATSSTVGKAITYSNDSDYYALNDAGKLYAYNLTGTEKWNVDLSTYSITVPGESVCVDDQDGIGTVIYFGSNNGRVYAIVDKETYAEGYFAAAIGDSWISLGTASSVTEFPIVWGSYIWCPAGTRMTKRDKTDGSFPPFWVDYNAPNTITTPVAVDNNYIYFGCDNSRAYCINATTGALVSQSGNLGGSVTSAPFTYMNKVYTAHAKGGIIRFNTPTNLGDLLVIDMDGGGTNGIISDVWVGLNADFIYCTDGANGNLYKRNFADLTMASTWPFAGKTLYAPLEVGGKIFMASKSGTDGYVYVLNNSDGNSIDPLIWPYYELGGAFRSPICIDLWNNVFLTGCDNNNVYIFTIPQ